MTTESAPEPGRDAAPTPGQAAYGAYAANRGIGWERLADRHREGWEAAAQAAMEVAGRFGPEQIGTIAGTVAVHERDKAAGELERLRAHTTSLEEDLDDAGATIADYREALTVMQAERDQARDLLRRAADALWNSSKAALTVKTSLDKPYPDDPRWSPWTRWAERPAREAHDTAMAIRKHLSGETAAASGTERAGNGDGQ